MLCGLFGSQIFFSFCFHFNIKEPCMKKLSVPVKQIQLIGIEAKIIAPLLKWGPLDLPSRTFGATVWRGDVCIYHRSCGWPWRCREGSWRSRRGAQPTPPRRCDERPLPAWSPPSPGSENRSIIEPQFKGSMLHSFSDPYFFFFPSCLVSWIIIAQKPL